jgi:hypothetical protein
MHIALISTITVGVVTPIFTTFSVLFFKKDVLDFYDKNIKYLFGDSNNNRNFRRATQMLPLSNFPVTSIKEIELINLPVKKYIIIENPENNITLGIETMINNT